jgi:hypothetical protein
VAHNSAATCANYGIKIVCFITLLMSNLSQTAPNLGKPEHDTSHVSGDSPAVSVLKKTKKAAAIYKEKISKNNYP